MSQYEQENDLGAGGGQVDDETMDAAWDTAADRRGVSEREHEREEHADKSPQPTAKFSSGDRELDPDADL